MKFFKIFSQGFFALVILLMVTILPRSTALADSEGPYSPLLGSNADYINGTEEWNSPEEITTPGLPYTSVTLYQGHRYSEYLMGSDFDFAVPPDMPIYGIEVRINRMSTGHNPSVVDTVVSLVKGGTVVGDNKAVTGTSWPTVLTEVTYGGPTDLWGSTWTAADINSADFGVVLAVNRDNNGNNNRDALVDSMQITVYFGNTTTAAIECGAGTSITYGDSISCVVTITAGVTDLTPSGVVNWTSDSIGTFSPNPCTLSGASGAATCTAVYTPHEVGTGIHKITATYDGDNHFFGSNATQEIEVLARPITVTADSQTKLYGEVDPLLSYQITHGSLVFGDTFSGSLTREPGEMPGSYNILQGTLALPNSYALTFEGATFTIINGKLFLPLVSR